MDPVQHATQRTERFRERFASSGDCLRNTPLNADGLRSAETRRKLERLIPLGLSGAELTECSRLFDYRCKV